MNSRIDILNELNAISPLIAGIGNVNVFTVPDGYFDSLSGDILGILNEQSSSIISSVPVPSSFEVPNDYFDNLADTIIAKIKAQEDHAAVTELNNLSPVLESLRQKNVFEVPQGYFDNLAGTILASVKPQQARVVTMHRRTNTFMKYAVAAVFTGAMVFGIFKFNNKVNTNTVDPVVAQGTQIAKDHKFDEELAKVTDADIVKYLESNNTDVDAALVANSVDENELPSKEDYLTDDKALDKYLNSINLNDLKN